jgi:Sec-independent protein secretion pathway component TatC
MLDNSTGRQRQTDVFAILCFATGMISIFLLPIVLMPACYICGIVSYYRLKENRNLKGQGLRITGWIFGTISFLYLLWLYQIGPFQSR